MPVVAVSLGIRSRKSFWAGDRCDVCDAPADVVPASSAARGLAHSRMGQAGRGSTTLPLPSAFLSVWGTHDEPMEDGDGDGDGEVFVAPMSCPPYHVFDRASCGCRPVCSLDACKNGGEPVLLVHDTAAAAGGKDKDG